MFFESYGNAKIVRLCEERGWALVAPGSGLFSVLPVMDIADQLCAMFALDRECVFLLGHSMGAGQVIQAATAQPSAYSGIAVLGGGAALKDPSALSALPVFIAAGEKDFGLPGARAMKLSLEHATHSSFRFIEYPRTEHLTIVQEALPDVFRFFDEVKR
jgi:pimeloyl-ACP methyl ester carboxylesterase